MTQPATMQQSQLLRALDQLDSTAWAQTLLPLLTTDESAGNFALSCKRLRKLCHGNQGHLHLDSDACMHLGPTTPLDYLQQRFPSCSSIRVTIHFKDALVDPWLRIARLLARLQNLSELHLVLNSVAEGALSMLLCMLEVLRLQLPQVRTLDLSLLEGSITSTRTRLNTGAGPIWEIVGQATQLTKLHLSLKDCCRSGLVALGLSALLPLSSTLCDLLIHQVGDIQVEAESQSPSIAAECWHFLSHLTCLTSLEVDLNSSRTGLSAIQSCTALRRLQLYFKGHPLSEAGCWPSIEECAALAQLTGLTELALMPLKLTPLFAQSRAADGAEAVALKSMMQHLPQLEDLYLSGLYDLDCSHLPVLACLPRLTHLECSWAPNIEIGWQGTKCSQILYHKTDAKGIPVQALPELTSFVIQEPLKLSQLADVAYHCKKLKELDVISLTGPLLAPYNAERGAALRSLTALQLLTQLHITVQDDIEVAAITELTQLRRLHLTIWASSRVSPVLLASLCKLTQLCCLGLDLQRRLTEQEAGGLLYALGGAVRCVEIDTISDQQESFKAAISAAQAAGVRLPRKLTLCSQSLI